MKGARASGEPDRAPATRSQSGEGMLAACCPGAAAATGRWSICRRRPALAPLQYRANPGKSSCDAVLGSRTAPRVRRFRVATPLKWNLRYCGLTIFLADRGGSGRLHPLRSSKAMRIARAIMASAKTVLVVGGKGGLTQHYRDAVEHEGYQLVHFERKVPPKGRRGIGKAALVVVMISMVSHALAQQVRELVPEGASLVYLKSPSVSALRAAISGQSGTHS